MQDTMMSGNEWLAGSTLPSAALDHDGMLLDTTMPLPMLQDEDNDNHLFQGSLPSTPVAASPATTAAETGTPHGQQATTLAAPVHQLDETDRMLCHQDFPALVNLAARVKAVRDVLGNPVHSSNYRSPSHMDPNQVMAAVSRMQAQFLSKQQQQGRPVLSKGVYPMTDSMLEESLQILQHELERCEKLVREMQQPEAQPPPSPAAAAAMQQQPPPQSSSSSGKRRKKKGDAIAVKYSKWQTDILMEWMISHKEHPFPDAQQIQELCRITGLSHSQVVNWTTNVRKRNMKATVEHGKKPHHFLDFLFLASNRDKQNQTTTLNPVSPFGKSPAAAMMTPSFGGGGGGGGVETDYPTVTPSSASSLPAGYNPYQDYPLQQAVSSGNQVPPPTISNHASVSNNTRDDDEDDWEMKLRVVSESFDENDMPEPTLLNQLEDEFQHGDSLLTTFAQQWKHSSSNNNNNNNNGTSAAAAAAAASTVTPSVSTSHHQKQASADLTSVKAQLDELFVDMMEDDGGVDGGTTTNPRKRKESFSIMDWEHELLGDDDDDILGLEELDEKMHELVHSLMEV
jgi:hypothetical protein